MPTKGLKQEILNSNPLIGIIYVLQQQQDLPTQLKCGKKIHLPGMNLTNKDKT